MPGFHREICDTINDRDDITFSSVAEKIEASKQCMSKFKKDGTIGFRKLLRLSYYVFPDEQREKMEKWCLQLDSAESIQQSFEYAAITRNVTLLKKLLKLHKKEKGVIGDYVNVYNIIYKYMNYDIEGYEIIENLKNIDYTEDATLRILVNILKCYDYFAKKKIHLMLDLALEVEEMIKKLSNSRKLFIKECYLHRLAEILAPIYLHRNELELARHYSSLIINANICAKTVSDASYYLGMTYLIEDKEKCMKYLQKSHDIAKTIGIKNLINQTRDNLDYVKIYLRVPLGRDSDARLVMYQNNTRNIKMIDDYIKERGERDFLLMYRACSQESLPELYECFQRFFSNSNFFFSSLIAKEIFNRGDHSMMTQMLINFKSQTVKGEVHFEKSFIRSFRSFNTSFRGICA
ncbi:AimR family lysis-lysogeny pheromone receptor [Bacillus sp. UNC437CL72CviS29]|uniref:AimR family lysis-lysogeny pheromone receptor n=1 Tax=Bacillus sp. UNC437CL72CviS29 TaxID=1340430 RepID=UPI00047B3D9E|nr:AimR family lysis-lysogeny pheromone receptor [Bacillus sp. UNC437CL72CviS29]